MNDSPCNPARCAIAMAASAGGLKALSVILGALPADFPAAMAIVMPLSPDHESILAEILSSRSPLDVRQAHAGDRLCHSSVFVAPPGTGEVDFILPLNEIASKLMELVGAGRG